MTTNTKEPVRRASRGLERYFGMRIKPADLEVWNKARGSATLSEWIRWACNHVVANGVDMEAEFKKAVGGQYLCQTKSEAVT